MTFCYFVDRFVCKNTGVLFETDILQVGIKSEFKEGKGKYNNNGSNNGYNPTCHNGFQRGLQSKKKKK